MCVCVSVRLSVCLSVSQVVYLSVCQSVYMCMYMYMYLRRICCMSLYKNTIACPIPILPSSPNPFSVPLILPSLSPFLPPSVGSLVVRVRSTYRPLRRAPVCSLQRRRNSAESTIVPAPRKPGRATRSCSASFSRPLATR